MDKFIVTGKMPLHGTISVSGAKNVALKTLVAACLTDEEVVIHNIPHISDFFEMVDVMKGLGAQIFLVDHTVKIKMGKFTKSEIELDETAQARTSSMFIAPLLIRTGKALIPNPGGCRLGARPIDRTIEGLKKMGAKIEYRSDDGYFHASVIKNDTNSLKGVTYRFSKNTHTGTETLILAAVLAKGKTILENAAEEPEIDELIDLLNRMGGKVKRTEKRQITIEGVERLHGAEITIKPDRNEIVTYAIAAYITNGDITVEGAATVAIDEFLSSLKEAGLDYEVKDDAIRFFDGKSLKATNIETSIYPGFMTDWQAPWAVLMTKANGISTIHETVFENKMGYVVDLKRMGAKAELFNPLVKNPEKAYNYNLSDDNPSLFHAVKIYGPKQLHNGIVTMLDIRAGAAVVLAALAATGTSTIFGIDKLDRGYEKFDEKLRSLGAKIQRVKTN